MIETEKLRKSLKPIFDLSLKDRGNLFANFDIKKLDGVQCYEIYNYVSLGKLDDTKGVIIPYHDKFVDQCRLLFIKPVVEEADVLKI